MRILTDVAHLLPVGGIESSTLQDVAALVERGHHVDIVFSLDGGQREDYAALGVGIHGPVPFKVSRRNAFRDVFRILPGVLEIRRLKADVLWLNRAEHIVWAQVISRIARIPVVVHLHHAPSSGNLDILSRGIRRFLAVSEFTKRQWVGKGVRADKVDVLHNAIPAGGYPLGGDAERDTARASLGLPADAPIVLYYGRMSEEKGVRTLLQAWRDLAHPTALLVLVGFPDPHENPELAEELDVIDSPSVLFLPARADVVPALHAADLVVVPSWVQEAFGRSVIEAMSTGRPVIGARVGGVPEILTGEMSDLLVESRNTGALRDAIARLLPWRETDPGLGARCRAWVDERFPYPAHVDELERVLQAESRSRAKAAG